MGFVLELKTFKSKSRSNRSVNIDEKATDFKDTEKYDSRKNIIRHWNLTKICSRAYSTTRDGNL